MNADDIFKKYVLKTKPEPEIKSLRGTGRTTKAILKLSIGSIYVCPTMSIVESVRRIPEFKTWHKPLQSEFIHVLSLDQYLEIRQFLGKRVENGEIVCFDHTVYEFGMSDHKLDVLRETNIWYKIAGFNVLFDEQYYRKFHPYS